MICALSWKIWYYCRRSLRGHSGNGRLPRIVGFNQFSTTLDDVTGKDLSEKIFKCGVHAIRRRQRGRLVNSISCRCWTRARRVCLKFAKNKTRQRSTCRRGNRLTLGFPLTFSCKTKQNWRWEQSSCWERGRESCGEKNRAITYSESNVARPFYEQIKAFGRATDKSASS